MKIKNRDTRYHTDCELRAVKEDNGDMFIEGVAAVFNKESRLIMDLAGTYIETIGERAFDNVLASDNLDVLLTYNHDKTKILARSNKQTGANTLTLSKTDTGLAYRALLPNTENGREVFELVSRGDLSESSFVFRVKKEGQRWDFSGDVAKRHIEDVAGLFDVSVVWKGAYATPSVETAQRHFQEAQDIINDEQKGKNKILADNDIDEMTVKVKKLR